jgi:hypothetical protein
MIDGGDPHRYLVSLTGFSNAQFITVTLSNVIDSAGTTPTPSRKQWACWSVM